MVLIVLVIVSLVVNIVVALLLLAISMPLLLSTFEAQGTAVRMILRVPLSKQKW